MGLKEVWCVKAKDGVWCAVAGGLKPAEDASNVPTRCRMFVVLPWGSEKRVPTCPACRANMTAGRFRQQGVETTSPLVASPKR
jgi:hypothetical protein